MRRRTRGRDRGVASLELLGIMPFLMLVAMAAIQLGIVAYVGSEAGSAARTAARTAALGDRAEAGPEDAGKRSVSSWLSDGTTISTEDTGDGVRATAEVKVPSIIPLWNPFKPVSRHAEMPKD